MWLYCHRSELHFGALIPPTFDFLHGADQSPCFMPSVMGHKGDFYLKMQVISWYQLIGPVVNIVCTVVAVKLKLREHFLVSFVIIKLYQFSTLRTYRSLADGLLEMDMHTQSTLYTKQHSFFDISECTSSVTDIIWNLYIKFYIHQIAFKCYNFLEKRITYLIYNI